MMKEFRKRNVLAAVVLAGLIVLLAGCSMQTNDRRAVYLLLDTSGTYSQEMRKADAILAHLLNTLGSGESLAVARIDSGSFSEKDILAKATFDERPSMANSQKLAFRSRMEAFFKDLQPSRFTDIRGGMLQATEWLEETGAGHRFILLFTDLEEDLPEGHVREFIIPLEGVTVVALNVTKLRQDNVDPREYLDRLAMWEGEVARGGGNWRVMNDLERLDKLLVD